MENNRLAGSRFEVEQTLERGFRFSFFDACDHLVIRSPSFSSMHQAAEAIAVVKRSIGPSNINRLRSRAGMGFYFTIGDSAHSVLAASAMFMSLRAREAAIAIVFQDGPTAPVFNGCVAQERAAGER